MEHTTKLKIDGIDYDVPTPVYEAMGKLFTECSLARKVIDGGTVAFGPLVPMFAPFISPETGIDLMAIMPKIAQLQNDKTLPLKAQAFNNDLTEYNKYRASLG